jgi:hypothetical protein
MDNKRYHEFAKIANKITGGDERSYDLLHDVLLQLENNKKYQSLDHKDQLWFFVRVMQNQYKSNNSLFHKTYRKNHPTEIPLNYEVVDDEYEEYPTMDWINETLEQELKTNPDSWYNIGIFRLWMENKKIEVLHKKTKIPKYSIRQTIRDMKLWIKLKWKEYKDGNNQTR